MGKKEKKQGISLMFVVFMALVIILAIVVIVVCVKDKKSSNIVEKLNQENTNVIHNGLDVNWVTNDKVIEKNKENWYTISKYNYDLKKEQDVKVKLSKLYTDDDALKYVKEFFDSDSEIILGANDNNSRWYVVEYELDLDSFTMERIGANSGIASKVFVNKNGLESIIVSYDLNMYDFSKEKTRVGRFAYKLDKNISDYYIRIGAEEKYLDINGK